MFTWFLGERCAINKEPMLYGYKKNIKAHMNVSSSNFVYSLVWLLSLLVTFYLTNPQ